MEAAGGCCRLHLHHCLIFRRLRTTASNRESSLKNVLLCLTITRRSFFVSMRLYLFLHFLIAGFLSSSIPIIGAGFRHRSRVAPVPLPPPTPPSQLTQESQPFEIIPWSRSTEVNSYVLPHQLKLRYGFEQARAYPSPVDPIQLSELEDQIRRIANDKRFVVLGTNGIGNHGLKLAFPIQHAGDTAGARKFAFLTVQRHGPGTHPTVSVHGYVSVAGVQELESRLHTHGWAPSPLTVGRSLSTNEVFDVIKLL